MRWRGLDAGAVALLLLAGLPPLALQLAGPVPRLDADAVEYFSQLRSLYYDRDVDLANEYTHFGILGRGDKLQPTVTGHRRTVFSIGPALMWLPFYAAGDLLARALGAVEAGYSASHIRAVSLASLAYAAAGLLLVRRVLRSLVSPPVAFWSCVLLLYGTFLLWYVTHEPVMSHAVAFFLAALVLALWWPARSALSTRRALGLGLAIGLLACVRWQGAVLLLLPAASLLHTLRRSPAATLARAATVLAAFLAGALPQMLAWKAIYGSLLLADPPQGRDFLRLWRPFLLETLFSSRHGLLFWTPLLWAAGLGFVWLFRRERAAAAALLAPVLVMTYVNACSGDWWAGGSFGNRRFDTLLPLLAPPLALALAALERLAARRPALVWGAAGVLLTAWNMLLVEQYRREMIPRDESVSFAQLTENQARLASELIGTPLAWPANWLFAARHDLPVAQYDRLVGLYLFYKQNNLAGVIDVGADLDQDAALLADGWSVRHPCGGGACRDVEGRARVLVPLDLPETLDVTLRAAGPGRLRIEVNGHAVAEPTLGPELEETAFRVPAARFRRNLNQIALILSPGGVARVDRLVFTRPEAAP